jgi:hypothetical protein
MSLHRAGSAPSVVEADGDPFFRDLIGGHLVAKPALKQNKISGFGRVSDEALVGRGGFGGARRSRHKSIKTRVFEFDSRAAGGRLHVVSAAHEGEGMEVQAVGGAGRHHIDPTIGHVDFAAAEIKIEGFAEGFDVARDPPFEGFKRTGEAMQGIHGGVTRVAAGVVFFRPFPTGRIEGSQLITFGGELGVEAGKPRFLEAFAVNVGGKMDLGRHSLNDLKEKYRRDNAALRPSAPHPSSA